jgi:aminoglycoside phosphotransferase (APT) family kinase protein
MNPDFQEIVCRATGADACFHVEDIQSLWSGYGKIMRYGLKGGDRDLVVVKHVKLPDKAHHPRGWNTDRSHQRKVKSYQVESAWYRSWASYCTEPCRIPHCLAVESNEDEFLMVFEDLEASGFSVRKNSVSLADMQACLRWLAHFHATFMGETPTGLWAVGTYWHLDTRPDEWAALDDVALKKAAAPIDQCLRTARYQTFVHGDAKLANFCFSRDGFSGEGVQVAAVDFQYVGGGCGMKDVAYFIGSCLNEDECERYEGVSLDYYFAELRDALKMHQHDIEYDAIEQEWRALYPVAWTDFHRYVKGWSPGHWKIHSYSERLARQVIAYLSEAGS